MTPQAAYRVVPRFSVLALSLASVVTVLLLLPAQLAMAGWKDAGKQFETTTREFDRVPTDVDLADSSKRTTAKRGLDKTIELLDQLVSGRKYLLDIGVQAEKTAPYSDVQSARRELETRVKDALRDLRDAGKFIDSNAGKSDSSTRSKLRDMLRKCKDRLGRIKDGFGRLKSAVEKALREYQNRYKTVQGKVKDGTSKLRRLQKMNADAAAAWEKLDAERDKLMAQYLAVLEELDDETGGSAAEKLVELAESLDRKIDSLDSKLADLDSKIAAGLKAEGRFLEGMQKGYQALADAATKVGLWSLVLQS